MGMSVQEYSHVDLEGTYFGLMAGMYESLYVYEEDNPDAWMTLTHPDTSEFVVPLNELR